MKLAFIISLTILGFIVGVPLIIAGNQYWQILKDLSVPKIIILIFSTTTIGMLIEGVFKKYIGR